MEVSIIVPVLDEALALPALLTRLLPLQQRGCELLLVDGGSKDGSAGLAMSAGATLLHAQRGRARQMNAGAAHASGEALLFLHADSQLPEDALALVTAALSGKTHSWGRFDVRIAGRPAMLRVIGFMMNLRSRCSGIATGDQAIFVRRIVFESVGGFPDQPLMEDIELSQRLRKLSWPVCISQRVITSGRRWETHGVWRTMLLMWRLRWQYWRGVPAQQLAKTYR